MILRTVVLCIFFISTIQSLKLHEHMTTQEIESVFNCKHDDVYKLEYIITSILDNDNEKIEVKAFEQNYTLYIENNNHVLYGSATPVYTAKRNPSAKSDILYTRVPHPFVNIEVYHDVKNRAAITIHRDVNNRSHVDGLIGDDIVIRSLPTRIHEEVLTKYPDLFQPIGYTVDNTSINQPTNNYQHTAHLVIRQNYHEGYQSQTDFIPNFKIKNVQNISEEPITNSPVQLLTSSPATINENIVYPQIMIVVDHESYLTHGSSVQTILKYMAAFWNAVDLRFRELQDPKVRLNIARIIIAEESYGAQYMEDNGSCGDIELIEETLNRTRDYFKDQTHFARNTYDVIVGLSPNYNCFIGAAQDIGVACSDDSVVIITDKGSFYSISTAAHELGHILGAYHDFDMRTESGDRCPENNLMGYKRVHINEGVRWSECSIRSLRSFMTSSGGMCLKNKPNVGTPYPKIMPGTLLSRDEQCQKQFGKTFSSVKKKEYNCVLLYCARYNATKPIELPKVLSPPAEGSPCIDGGICLNGECVTVPRDFVY